MIQAIRHSKKIFRIVTGALLATSLRMPAGAQNAAPFHFNANSNLVLISVVVRDRQGHLVKGLTRNDFELREDKKPQRIATFDFENVDEPMAAAAAAPVHRTALTPAGSKIAVTPALNHRRLVVLFFDLTGMQPEEIGQAVESGKKYVRRQRLPADLVAVASLSTSLEINQDFTNDRDKIQRALNALNPAAQAGLEQGSTGTTEGQPDSGSSFTPDDTEFNVFNTDYRLEALEALAEMLTPIQEKKSVIYFAGGMSKTGIENEAELRAAINAAVKANVALYTVDTRGLQALPPGGEAQNASLQGVAPYSGQSTLNQYDSNFDSQETLATLASDTGGQAFFDNNDFGRVYESVQEDTSAYYILGYHSSNPVQDGAFRHVSVRLRRPGLKLRYQAGYYAPRDSLHRNQSGREQQLEDELASQLPENALPFYLATGYFQLRPKQYFLSANIAIPGRELTQGTASNKDQVDVAARVEDANGNEVGRLRDRIRLNAGEAIHLKERNLQYNTGFVLPPGHYRVRFVVRENQTGQMGAFETHWTIPDLQKQALEMSSILLGNQLAPVAKKQKSNPLTWGQSELVPSVTHVFAAGRPMYLYFEVYRPESGGEASPDVQASVMLFRGRQRVLVTAAEARREWSDASRQAVVYQLEVPLQGLPPGFYTCQVNVIDRAGKHFAFPRTPLLIRAAAQMARGKG